jgi:ubiquitin carboxyl-terminal hydrolase 5/13
LDGQEADTPNHPPFSPGSYYVDTDWTAKKLAVAVPVPETLDLEAYRSTGMLPGEVALPDEPEPAAAAPAAPTPDEGIVGQLVSMGFSENGAKRAALAVSNSNAEAATEWVFAHMGDTDFNDPLPPPGHARAAPTAADPEAVSMLGAMGFDERQATAALRATGGSIERAADWLFSHSNDIERAVAAELGMPAPPPPAAGGGDPDGDDGRGLYDLVGFVSHMGSNTSCGHYVCHVKKEGRWVLHNDRKVAASEATPLDLGYIYFFRRRDA